MPAKNELQSELSLLVKSSDSLESGGRRKTNYINMVMKFSSTYTQISLGSNVGN